MNIVKLKTNFEIQFKVGVKLAVRLTVPNAEVASKRASIALIGWSFVARITPGGKKDDQHRDGCNGQGAVNSALFQSGDGLTWYLLYQT